MEVRVLGPLEVRVDDADLTPTSPNQRKLLAVLAAHPDRYVRVDALIDALWGSDPPPTAERTVRSYISRLRAVMGSSIAAGGGGFSLRTNGIRLDSSEFERQVDGARLLEPRAAAGALQSALGLWFGSAFGEAADVEQVRSQAGALEQVRVGARKQLVEALAQAGDHAAAAARAEALIADFPLDERAWELLVRALSAAGRVADALHAYRRAYDALVAEGLEPSERLQRAQQDAYGSPVAVPTPPVLPGRHLVGRGQDLAALASLLENEPLITIVGPGGVGKTTLALEAARRRAAAHGGGLRVVELAALSDPAAVPEAVVTALGLASDGGAALTVLQRVRSMDVVIVMDNCEHLLDAVCEVLDAILGPAPTYLRVIATSRELLGMPTERAWPLQPLDYSQADAPAQQYFRQRADACRPGSVGGADQDLVSDIVRQLDGLPLAIELAAAQVATLGLDEIAEQVESSISAHTALAQLSRRGGEPRHRTLRAAIEWSEQQLSDDAKAALAQWTVFAGAVRLADAQAVLQVPSEVVTALARRSLLSVETRSGRTYYRMLQTVRAVVGATSESTRRRHLEYIAAVVADAAACLETPDEARAHQRILELVDELRVAHAYARHTDVDAAVALSMSLHRFGVSRLHTESLGWAAKLVPLVQERPALRAAVDSSLAYRAVIAEQLGSAEQRARGALADTTDDQVRCHALEALSDRALFIGDLPQATQWLTQLIDVGRRGGHIYYELIGEVGLAMTQAYDGRRAAARQRVEDIEARFADAPLSPTHRSWLAYLHGEVLLDDDPLTALAAFDRAIQLADAVGSNYVAGVARLSAITLHARHSSARTTLPLYADVMQRWLDTGSWSHLLTAMRNLVPALADVRADVAATRLLGAVTRPEQTPTYGQESERLSAAASRLSDTLGAADFARERAIGSTQDLASAARAAVAAILKLTAPQSESQHADS